MIALFSQLVAMLGDVSTWGGPVGAGAADGLRILKAGQVDKELDGSIGHLESAKFADAITSERTVIRGLEALLEKIQGLEGLIGSSQEEALKLVREMMKKQEQLRQETKQTQLTEKNAEALVEKQAQVRKDLNKLNEALERVPAAVPLLEQAKAAAYEATADLFDAKKEEALAEQSKVLGNLAQIEEQLQNAADPTNSNRSADQLAQQAKDLQKAKEDLNKIQAQQQQVEKTAEKNAPAAKPQEEQVAAALAKVDDGRDLPAAVDTRLAQAEDAAKQAATGPMAESPQATDANGSASGSTRLKTPSSRLPPKRRPRWPTPEPPRAGRQGGRVGSRG